MPSALNSHPPSLGRPRAIRHRRGHPVVRLGIRPRPRTPHRRPRPVRRPTSSPHRRTCTPSPSRSANASRAHRAGPIKAPPPRLHGAAQPAGLGSSSRVRRRDRSRRRRRSIARALARPAGRAAAVITRRARHRRRPGRRPSRAGRRRSSASWRPTSSVRASGTACQRRRSGSTFGARLGSTQACRPGRPATAGPR
jgi:hypothetical protein